jgi:hypothetical protein
VSEDRSASTNSAVGQIVSTLALAAQLLDDGRVDDLSVVFADDARVEVLGRELVGWPAIGEFFDTNRRAPEDRGTHMLSLPFVVVSDDGRSARTSTDFHVVGRREPVPPGRYYDTFERRGGRFVIVHRVITSMMTRAEMQWPRRADIDAVG